MLPISTLQENADNIRNVCIIAHVDHGKTTLCDSLVATNGFISNKSAGKLRFLDSREDEQERMITMKSSAISLRWWDRRQSESPRTVEDAAASPTAQPAGSSCSTKPPVVSPRPAIPANQQYLINLVDSPGHVDFTSEVSTATRLSDGAIVVVDVVEGISSQTREVLRQAWNDQVRTILLLNKMDRLFINLKLSADEAYLHLSKVIEQANACAGELLQAETLANAAKEADDMSPAVEKQLADSDTISPDAGDGDHELEFDETKTQQWTYHPAKGNVLFASAMHGWGFSIQDFSKFVAKRTGASEVVLNKTLWGDYWFNVKARKVMRMRGRATDTTDQRSTMFSQFCLETIRRFYLATGTTDNSEQTLSTAANVNVSSSESSEGLNLPMLEKMVTQIPELTELVPRLPKLKPGCVREVLGTWMPISEVLLRHVVSYLPSPVEAARYRVPPLLEYPVPTASSSGVVGAIGSFLGETLGALGSLAVKTAKSVSSQTSQTGGDGSKVGKPEVRKELAPIPLSSSALGRAVLQADSSSPAVCYCTKYLGADLERSILLGDRLVTGNGKNQDQFVAMLRVFAGTLLPGMNLMQASAQATFVGSGKTAPPTTLPSPGGGETTADVGNPIVTPTIQIAQNTGSENPAEPADSDEGSASEWIVVENSEAVPPAVQLEGGDGAEGKDDLDETAAVGKKPSKYDNDVMNEYQTVLKDWPILQIEQLYTILGSSLQPVKSAPAGSVVAASFVGSSIYRSERYLTLIELTDGTKKQMRAFNSVLALKAAQSRGGDIVDPTPVSDTANPGNVEENAQATAPSSGSSKKSPADLEFTDRNWLPVFKSPYQTRSFAILKVSIEVVKNLEHDRQLVRGLSLLHRADPSLEITHSQSGEHLIGCCGDEHLKRSIKDLQNLYLPPHIEIRVSDPLVALRETIVAPKTGFGTDLVPLPWAQKDVMKDSNPNMSQSGQNQETVSSTVYPVTISTPNKLISLVMRAEPLAEEVLSPADSDIVSQENIADSASKQGAVRDADSALFEYVKRKHLPNLAAICNTKGAQTALSFASTVNGEIARKFGSWLRAALVTGFELASRQGPLCEEPVVNVHFVVESLVKSEDDCGGKTAETICIANCFTLTKCIIVRTTKDYFNFSFFAGSRTTSTLNGLVISLARDACRSAMLRRSTPRICEPFLLLNVQCDQALLGKVYPVLAKRRAQILEEDLREGTSTFCIKLKMPLMESFSLAGELRHQGSGDVHYHAQFCGFEVCQDLI